MRACDSRSVGRRFPLAALAALVLMVAGCDEDEDSTTSAPQGSGGQGGTQGTSDQFGGAVSPLTLNLNGQTFEIPEVEAIQTCQQLQGFTNVVDLGGKLAGIISLGRLDEEAIGMGTIAFKIANAYCPDYRLPSPTITQLND